MTATAHRDPTQMGILNVGNLLGVIGVTSFAWRKPLYHPGKSSRTWRRGDCQVWLWGTRNDERRSPYHGIVYVMSPVVWYCVVLLNCNGHTIVTRGWLGPVNWVKARRPVYNTGWPERCSSPWTLSPVIVAPQWSTSLHNRVYELHHLSKSEWKNSSFAGVKPAWLAGWLCQRGSGLLSNYCYMRVKQPYGCVKCILMGAMRRDELLSTEWSRRMCTTSTWGLSCESVREDKICRSAGFKKVDLCHSEQGRYSTLKGWAPDRRARKSWRTMTSMEWGWSEKMTSEIRL